MLNLFFATSCFSTAATAVVQTKGDDNDKVSVFTFGARGDGQTDDADAIKKAITYSLEHDKACFIPKTSACYNIGSTIRIPLEVNRSLRIISNGAIIKPLSPPNNSSAFNLTTFKEHIFLSIGKPISTIRGTDMFKNSEGSSISIRGLVIDGGNMPTALAPSSLNTDIFVGLQALAETVNLTNCTFRNIYGYGATIYNVKNSTLTNCKFENVGGRGATPFAKKIDRDAFGDGVHYSLVKANGNINLRDCDFRGLKSGDVRSRSAITFEFSTQPYNIYLSYVNISGFAKCMHIEETAATKVDLNNVNMTDFNFGLANVLNNDSEIHLNHVRMDIGISDGNDAGDALAFLNYRSNAQIFVNNSYLNFRGNKQSYQSAPGLVKVDNTTINGNGTNFFFADGNTIFDHCVFIGFGGKEKSFFSHNGQNSYQILNSDLTKSARVHANGQKLKLDIK